MTAARRRRLSRPGLLSLLSELEADDGPAVSLHVPPGTPASDIERAVAIVPGVEDAASEVAEAASRSPTGAVLLWGDHGRYLVMPPFPVAEKLLSSGYDVDPLRSLIERDLLIALVLVRLGAYAIGVFRGRRLVSSKVGTGLVHSRHKKGGSSQRRFERRRENQMQTLFDRVCVRVRERLGPYATDLDHVVYGGEKHTLDGFRRRCDFLRALDQRVLPRVLDVREPRQASLEEAIDDVWSSQLLSWGVTGPRATE